MDNQTKKFKVKNSDKHLSDLQEIETQSKSKNLNIRCHKFCKTFCRPEIETVLLEIKIVEYESLLKAVRSRFQRQGSLKFQDSLDFRSANCSSELVTLNVQIFILTWVSISCKSDKCLSEFFTLNCFGLVIRNPPDIS